MDEWSSHWVAASGRFSRVCTKSQRKWGARSSHGKIREKKRCCALVLLVGTWKNLILSILWFKILDPRFAAESLAALLSIPNSKTLLRRHLATHFQGLIGAECHQMKEQAANDPIFQPLMPGIKHKVQLTDESQLHFADLTLMAFYHGSSISIHLPCRVPSVHSPVYSSMHPLSVPP